MQLAQEAILLYREHLQLAEKKEILDQSRKKLLLTCFVNFFVLSFEENAVTFMRQILGSSC